MSRIGRNLKGSSSSIPFLDQEHLDKVTREHVQEGFECHQRRRHTTCSLFQCFVTPTVSKFFLIFTWNLLSSSLHSLPLVLSLDVRRAWLHLPDTPYILMNINEITSQSPPS